MPQMKKFLRKCGKGGIIEMNKKQYNNIIKNTLKRVHTEDSLSAARTVFKNMGVALPGGDIKEVFETVKTDNYMGWKSCTMEEAQAAANRGTAAIGISDSKIVVLAADDAEEPIEPTAEVLAITDSTPAVAVAGLQYYSYSYGSTSGSSTGSGGSSTTTMPIDYCGGSNYKDVTKHKMVLQCDGYYVCSKCGYRVKSPELEDKNILSTDDYLKVFSCLMFYAYLEIYRQKFPSVKDFALSQSTVMQLATEIRQKDIYKNIYSYSDGSGKCLGPNIDYNHMFSFVEKRDLNIFNIGDFNGLNNSINDLIIGIFCPAIAMTQNILDLITHQMNGIEFSSMVLDLCGYSNIANGLSLVSAVMDATNSGVSTNDTLIVIRLNNAIQGYFIFSPTGKFKMVKYTN